jgi:CubicO group peptidase (beta-lactamase class C family)
VTLPLALLAAAYFPPPDAAGGWRTGPPLALDEAFETAKASSLNGGLVVLHKGRMVFERYFGHGSRDATPNLASVGKSFTSISAGILIHERKDLFPKGLDQFVFTPALTPEAARADPERATIKLGHLLAMSSGIRGNNPSYVHGKPVMIDPVGPDGWQAMVEETAASVGMWCKPGEGYSYATAGIHLVSTMLRHITGMELQQFVEERIAKPLGWGTFGWGYNRPEIKHTPGGGGIRVRATDMLRYGYMLLNDGRWNDRHIVPADYVRLCRRASPYNPHYPYSLQFNVNSDGHVAGVPRDAFWKTGSGGHCIYVVPSLELVIWKLGGRNDQYDQRSPHPSREGWKASIAVDESYGKLLQSVVAAVRK